MVAVLPAILHNISDGRCICAKATFNMFDGTISGNKVTSATMQSHGGGGYGCTQPVHFA